VSGSGSLYGKGTTPLASHLASMERRITCNLSVFPGPRGEAATQCDSSPVDLVGPGSDPAALDATSKLSTRCRLPCLHRGCCDGINGALLLELNPYQKLHNFIRIVVSSPWPRWARHGLSSPTSTPLQGMYNCTFSSSLLMNLFSSLFLPINLMNHGCFCFLCRPSLTLIYPL
jgi:hypothetical protein